jgi:hypothetical protein
MSGGPAQAGPYASAKAYEYIIGFTERQYLSTFSRPSSLTFYIAALASLLIDSLWNLCLYF